MSSVTTVLRRSLWIIVLAAGVGAAAAWWRDREQASLKPAEWPPLEPAPAPTPGESVGEQGSTSADRPPTGSGSEGPPSAASFVNALVDAPEARSGDGASGGWVDPLDDGTCPIGHPIKANDNSGIFHVPDGRFYERTKPERCYSSDEAALADGYRRAKH